jgi:hypothetical protein
MVGIETCMPSDLMIGKLMDLRIRVHFLQIR